MCGYLKSRATGGDTLKPFVAVLSWGTPHDPYNTAPPKYAALYPDSCSIELRPNVPLQFSEEASRDLRGYYAHIAALDDCMAKLLRTLDETGLASNTIVVFTSTQDLLSIVFAMHPYVFSDHFEFSMSESSRIDSVVHCCRRPR